MARAIYAKSLRVYNETAISLKVSLTQKTAGDIDMGYIASGSSGDSGRLTQSFDYTLRIQADNVVKAMGLYANDGISESVEVRVTNIR